MIHNMKLKAAPFSKIESGIKTIELRLYDEKRSMVKPGDFIEFSCLENPEKKLCTVVTALHRYDSFHELYENLPLLKCGYTQESVQNAKAEDMEAYYPKEKQAQYGVVGIELRLTGLQRFLDAQEKGYSFGLGYNTALEEIKRGYKKTHWMWYIFPQIAGLGHGKISRYFSITDIEEAKDYINHPQLRSRLLEISSELLKLDTCDPVKVFGNIDAYKLRSSMTLFEAADKDEEVFSQVLDKYCMGVRDYETLRIIREASCL